MSREVADSRATLRAVAVLWRQSWMPAETLRGRPTREMDEPYESDQCMMSVGPVIEKCYDARPMRQSKNTKTCREERG